ncbi:hypothetical protein SEA_DIABLA_84 [Gordonia phage Diabla]|nr:hypothetical protein SEA_DIABLA_84 [Gordonia phage Diabla]
MSSFPRKMWGFRGCGCRRARGTINGYGGPPP